MRETPTTAAQALARFSAELHYADIPPAVLQRATDCIMDSMGAAIFGSRLDCSRIVIEQYVRRYGAGGPCSVLGWPDLHVQAPYAALANGVSAHAFELDPPGVPGAHPGATILPALLAAGEEQKIDGKTALVAFVAGCEVMFRIGIASGHACEQHGFHAPGIIGAYGAAVAVGCVLELNAEQMAHALGIAGSLSSGLLAFSHATAGGMVKRLHLGRAAESGILAARLAAQGYTGPETILEGQYGFLEAYCHGGDAPALSAGLKADWKTLRICIKRYPCHLSAHTSIQALRNLMLEERFDRSDVAGITIEGSSRLLSHHGTREPKDIAQAQYSVPFCVALSLFRDPEDPAVFDAGAFEDQGILAECRGIELRLLGRGDGSPRATRLHVRLRDGREFSRDAVVFKGMPEDPLNPAELRHKFLRLCGSMETGAAALLAGSLEHLEVAPAFSLHSLMASKSVKNEEAPCSP